MNKICQNNIISNEGKINKGKERQYNKSNSNEKKTAVKQEDKVHTYKLKEKEKGALNFDSIINGI